ncbi:MAG: formate dehydrogenase accessory sulfurtransferase FdhD [Smithella sp.]
MESNIGLNIIETEIIKVKGSDKQVVKEQVVIENALTVYLNDKEFVTMICSPVQEKELVTGMLCSEGIINKPEQLAKISLDKQEGLVWVETSESKTLGETMFLKRYLTSCCGKGRTSFYFANDARLTQHIGSDLRITAQEVSFYINLLEKQSELFRLTGGVHGGAVAAKGNLEFHTFDIGRLNVLDKIYGHTFTQRIDLSQKVIVFSGRMSSEIVIKIGKMGCPILIGVSAPTALALKLAEELGITVIGFARKDRFNIYTHPERILFSVSE